MTQRIQHLTVYLDQPIRDDDLQQIEAALTMIKHVSRVERGTPVDHTFHQYASTKGVEIFSECVEFLADKLLGKKKS